MRGSLAIQTRRHFLSNFYFTSAEWMTVDEKNSMGGFSFHSWGVLDTQHFSVKMSALVSWLVNRSVFLFFSVPFSVASPSRLRCDTVGQLLTEPIFSLLSGLILQASKNCTKKTPKDTLPSCWFYWSKNSTWMPSNALHVQIYQTKSVLHSTQPSNRKRSN